MTKRMHIIGLLVLGMAGFVTCGGGAAEISPATYDWSTATAGDPLDGNDNWVRLTGGATGTIENTNQPAGFSGNYLDMTGSFSRQYTRANDSSFSYDIPAGASKLIMSMVIEADSSTGLNWMGLYDADSNQKWRFGVREGENWGYRDRDSVIVELGNGSGDGRLVGARKSFRATVEMDLSSDKLDFLVDDLSTPGGPEILGSGLDIGSIGYPTEFDGLFLRGGTGANVDAFRIAPEPSSLALLCLAGLGLLGRRQR